MSTTTATPVFEQLAVGDELPPFTRGPLGTVHLFRWSAAIENLHRIHYDLPFATEHDGLPALPINGSWKQHFLVQAIRRWIEPEGWLAAIYVLLIVPLSAGATVFVLAIWGFADNWLRPRAQNA